MKSCVTSLEVDGKVIDDPSELAEEFNIHFSQIGDKLKEKLPDLNSDLSRLTSFVNSRKYHDVAFTLRDATVTQVNSIMKRVTPNKSAGIDKINARLLHLAATSYRAEYCKDDKLILLNWNFSSTLEDS